MTRRIERVNELVRKELSELLSKEMNDPRLPLLMSITRVEVSTDLRNAKIYVSVMTNREERESTVKVLQRASGFLHRELKKRLSLRAVPILSFRLDDSIEEGSHILEMMDNITPQGHPY